MPKNRRSKRCNVAAALALSMCSCGAPLATTVVAADAEKAPRKPDGVALDLPPAVPPASEKAAASGIVALREPLSDDVANDVVRTYVAGFVRKDAESIAALFTADAHSLDAKGVNLGVMAEGWRTRFRNLDYTKLAGNEVVDYGSIERYAFEELGNGSPLSRPPSMREGDLLLRVPVATPRVAGERYFGDVIVMLLRRDGTHYKIVGLVEEDAP